MPNFFILIFLLILSYTPHHLSYTPISHRRILHQPFIPLPSSNPPTQPPSSSPQSQPQQQTSPPIPKFPFSSSTPNKQPFFPSYPSPPPPTPSSSASSTNTFPANISSLIFPHTPHHKPISPKLVATAVILALFSISFIASIILLLYYKNRRKFPINKTSRSDSHRLFPANTAPSDGHLKVRSHGGATTGPSSEFLYLGTLVNSRGIDCDGVDSGSVGAASSTSSYVKLGSPELHPLPPLARSSSRQNYRNAGVGSEGEDEEEEFYSPRGSSGRKEESLTGTGSSSRRVSAAVGMENFESRSSNSSDPSSPTSNFNVGAKSFEKRSSNSSDRSSPTSNSALGVKKFESRSSNSSNSSCPTSNSASPTSLSPRSLKSKKFPDSVVKLPPPPPPLPRPMTPSPPKRKPTSPSPPSSPPERDLEKNPHSPSRLSNVSGQNQDSFARNIGVSRNTISFPPPPTRPPPPPPPLPKFWENPNPFTQVQELTISRPSVLITPSRPVAFNNSSNEVSPAEFSQNLEETPKPKLKPLHWDKVRASSDRAMVWDQLKSSSFQLNEEMIETLFVVNGTSMTPKETTWRPVLPPPNQENRVLDPKKSQNIAILLRALNVTIEEVCEALLEGNSDTLGTELLESLLKMAPTKEEERKLKDYKDDSPFKLGPAERFLKALLDIPFAFKRVDAMLYIANFDSEVEYLKKSFATLEAACEELRNNRMFIKLLEAVLKTGNRMNVGTNRGDAHAFKLDTLLKLVDVKGTDGKTTLLHFVVQEIIRAEGSRISVSNQSNFQNDIEFRKLGLPVVSGLSGDLTNVKKAAAMESDILSNDVSKLARGIGNVGEVLKLNETMGSKESSKRFSDSMNNFLKKAEEDIIKIQAQETVALSLVKEITEYFHGNSTKEEAHPFRIFMVVRDFLSVLDRVCKEVGKINERTTVSSARQFPVPINPTQPPVFPIFHAKPQYSSSEDESSSSS